MDRLHLLTDEAGFTLSELLVVLLIIGILVGIAVPGVLGQEERARAAVKTSADRNALIDTRSQELP